MSAVPTTSPREIPRAAPLPGGAKLFFGAVLAATAAAAAPPLASLGPHTHGWTTFAVLAASAGIAQLFVVRTIRDYSLHTAIVFLIAGALLLPPELVALMGVVQHIPEWLKQRYAWYIETFNIANYTLDALGAWWVAGVVERHAPVSDHRVGQALAGLAACVVFVVLNHVLLAGMLYLARGHRPQETGLFSWTNLSTELVLAALGIGLASLWRANPWLVPFVVAPIVLIHRSLHVPRLEEQARVDPKTGLFNARHFSTALAEELARSTRFGRPTSLIMADLDLLREINNTYGHLAGDAVLVGIAGVFRDELRHYDVPSRFGGEEFAIILPETPQDQALEIAERIRAAVAAQPFEVEASSEPIHATVSMGVATFPKDAGDANQLVHHADVAVYRAKLQGRNRVLAASAEPLLLGADPAPQVVALPEPAAVAPAPRPRSDAAYGPRLVAVSPKLALLVGLVGTGGIGVGIAGLVAGSSTDVIGMLAVLAAVALGQALALELQNGSVSVGAVGALTGVAVFGPRLALPVAATMALVDWSARRPPLHQFLFNLGTFSLATTAAAGMFTLGLDRFGEGMTIVMALCAGGAYYLTNMGLLTLALAVEGRQRWLRVWKERFAWLAPHYLGYGLVAGVMAIAYDSAGLYAVAVAVVPLVLVRSTQAAYLEHTQRNAHKLRAAAETIQEQNVSLEKANRLLRERSTAAMESLSATVDARDAYTAGHARRVQRVALAVGEELGLSRPELDLLGHAALFHDIGKVGLPDSILLKPDALDEREWGAMQHHAEEGARIIERLGFLEDAVPAIRHHHERWDGTGYPDRLRGDEIPLGARIIHVADALDTMLTTRKYSRAMAPEDAVAELRRLAGTQFCPRCVAALERVLPAESVGGPPELLIA
jgi:diguanylate cyclase (GGDEF)-like protein/putative nucleotidyltransferase with HDIG domain